MTSRRRNDVKACVDGARERGLAMKSAVNWLKNHVWPLKLLHPVTIICLLFCLACAVVNVSRIVPDGKQDWLPRFQLLLGSHSDADEVNYAPAYKSVQRSRNSTDNSTDFGDVFQCDRSNWRTDVCRIRGDVRMHGESLSIVLHTHQNSSFAGAHETIQPLARKWEESTMKSIDKITLTAQLATFPGWYACDLQHKQPAIVFSTGGFTGNVYHDFNDVLIPLFITCQHYKGEVIFVVTQHRGWWWKKYSKLLNLLSKHNKVVFQTDFHRHCFPEATVGLHIHGELMVDPALMSHGETIRDFQHLLAQAFSNPLLNSNQSLDANRNAHATTKPRLVMILRHDSTRILLNQDKIASTAQKLGFDVHKLSPGWYTNLRQVYQIMQSADVVLGVHGAALTHFLFMRPASVLIQIVPLGTDIPASQYYEEPALRSGLRYLHYKIRPEESSLLEKYPQNDPVLTDPAAVAAQGWGSVKEIYLNQDVRPNLSHLRHLLVRARNLVSNHS